MTRLHTLGLVCAFALLAGAAGCGDDDDDAGAMAGAGAAAGKGGSGGKAAGSGGQVAAAGHSGSGSMQSLCDKYGGKDNVAAVIKDHVIPEIASDCRVGMFFTSLPADRLTRVVECLSIQTEELFGCAGVTYQGSKASNGLPCRNMKEIHQGLGITTGDFDALLMDVVTGMTKAGVADADIQQAAPALVGLKADIVTQPDETEPSQAAASCDVDAGTEAGQ